MTISKKELRLKESLARIFKARSSVPAVEDLAHKLLEQFGGADAFATLFVTSFNNGSPMVKARLMEAAIKLVLLADKARPPRDLTGLGDEELLEIARTLVNNAEEEEAGIGIVAAPEVGPGAAGRGGGGVPEPTAAASPAAPAGDPRR